MKNKYYFHLKSIYLLIITIFVVAISLMYYFSSMRIVNLKNAEASKLRTEQTANRFDSELSLGIKVYNQIAMSDNVQTFLKNAEIDYINIISVMDELISVSGTLSTSSASIALGKIDSDTIVTTKCTKSLSSFFTEDIGISLDEGQHMLDTIKKKPFSYQSAISGIVDNKKSVTYIISSDVQFLNKKLICYLTFDIESFLPKSGIPKNSSIVIYDGNILYSHLAAGHRLDHIEENISLIYNNKTNYDYSNKSIGKLTYHYAPSEWSDLAFFFITPRSVSGIDYLQILLSTLILAFVLVILGFYAATKITNKIYSPVKQLISNMKTLEEIPKDEFSAIEHMLSSLNDEKNKLVASIGQKEDIIKSNLLRLMLQGLEFSQQEYSNMFSNDDYDWMKRDISVAIYRLTDNEKNTSDKTPDSGKSDKIHSIIHNTLIGDVQCEIISTSPQNNVLIFKADTEDNVIELLRQIFPYIEITFNVSVSIAFSQITCNLQNISIPYSRALAIIEANLANISHNNILLRSDMPETNTGAFYYPLEMESTLIDQALNAMSKGAENVIEQILTENFDKRILSPGQFANLKFALFVTISRIINQLPPKSIKKFYEEGGIDYKELEQCNTRAELKNMLMQMLSIIITSIDTQKKSQSTSFAADVMEYIAANYQNDIALTDISRHFNLSASYLSMLFKNNFGENFKEYLNIYRIKKAKEIINSGSYVTVKDLAAMVGFNNSDTFIRVFKRYEGVSPGQYQNRKFKD